MKPIQHTIDWPEWSRMINDSFIPLVHNRDRYLILYGGRGSSKSNMVAKLLIYRCLTDPYFRFILTRKYYNTIRNSSYKTLKDLIEGMGLMKMFKFRTQPYEIECLNGNMFISAGCDEPQKIKSVKDPTGVWYEEDVVDEESWITITTSIRTTKSDHLQEIFTINPEVTGDYREHWFFKRFFSKWWDGNDPSKLSRSGHTSVAVGEKIVSLPYTIHHSDHTHNKWLPDIFRAMLSQMKQTNPYYYEVYTLGKWGNKVVGGRFYMEFRRYKQVVDIPNFPRISAYKGYTKDQALHIAFDFNIRPYMTLIICQRVANNLFVIDEIAATEPNNSTPNICRLFLSRYKDHEGMIYVYGDPAGRHETTLTEQSVNQYSIIRKHLSDHLRVTVRIDKKAPAVELRGQFINEIFKNQFGGIRVFIDEKCIHMVDDFMYTQAAADGTKFKERVRDQETNLIHEKFGHFSDAFDYLMCKMFKEEWYAYKRGAKSAVAHQYVVGRDATFAQQSFNRW